MAKLIPMEWNESETDERAPANACWMLNIEHWNMILFQISNDDICAAYHKLGNYTFSVHMSNACISNEFKWII